MNLYPRACSAGLGERGWEGQFGFRRAFFLSGARSLIVPIRSVYEDEALLFVARFYEHWVPGEAAMKGTLELHFPLSHNQPDEVTRTQELHFPLSHNLPDEVNRTQQRRTDP